MSRIIRSPPTNSPLPHTLSDSEVNNLMDQEAPKFNITQRVKRPRETCCESQLQMFKEEIKSMIQEMCDKQNKNLNKLIKDVAEIKTQSSAIKESNLEIEKSLQFLSEQYDNITAKITNLEKERKEHLLHISTLEAKVEDIQKILKSSTLELRNVPCQSKTELKSDLTGIFQKVCKTIGIDIEPNNIKDVFRLKNKTGSSTIIAELTHNSKRQEILMKAKIFNKEHPSDRLNSAHIGMTGRPVPIFISESLTTKGRRLLYLARDLASSEGFKYCWTNNGKVYLRKTENSPHIEIKTENDIAILKISK